MDDNNEEENLQESVQELKIKLEAMKQMMENNEAEAQGRNRRKGSSSKASLINGNLLSVVFVLVLVLLISVTCYAFLNLYNAVMKKYSTPHTEL